MRNLICIVAIFTGLFTQAKGDEPSKLTSYNEVELADNISFQVDQIKRCLQTKFDSNPGKYKSLFEVNLSEDECHSVYRLGWLIIAAGEHFSGSDALKNALFRVKNDIGWVVVPLETCWEEKRERNVEYFMQEVVSLTRDPSSSKSKTYVDPGPESYNPHVNTHFYWLSEEAMEAITKRTGFKFPGYKGFEMFSRP